jgi:tetratricopeptide (TPR) repeat protein
MGRAERLHQERSNPVSEYQQEVHMAETTLREALRLAEDDIGAARPADALIRCRHILAHYPDMLEARRVLGEAYLAQQKTREAYQAFDRILVSDPENTLAYCNRALIHEQQNDLDAALDCYYQACELSLGNRQLRQEFRRLATQAKQPAFVLSRVGLARLYMRGDLLAHAIREWEQILQADPERVDARLGLAEALWRDGQTAQAAEQCRLILEAIPSCLKAHLLLGEIAYRANKPDEARHYLEQARRLDPDGRMAREIFADALVADEAFSSFLLAAPARIPVMEGATAPEAARTPHPVQVFTATNPEREISDIGIPLSTNASNTNQLLQQDNLTFPFLNTENAQPGISLQEGESLEQMLASLIERPTEPEPTPTPRLKVTAPPPTPSAKQPIDRLQALLRSFDPPEDPLRPKQTATAQTGESPLAPTNAEASASQEAEATDTDFAEGLLWSDSDSFAAIPPDISVSPGPSTATNAPEVMAGQKRTTGSLHRTSVWGDEEDTEAGWLRWLQAQGARQVGAPEETEVSTTFAALLQPKTQDDSARPALWEAPNLEFVRTYWPSDTVPHPAVRLTPGTSGRLKAINKRDLQEANLRGSTSAPDDLAALGGISSVSLRPLTLEELEHTIALSGLKPASGLPGAASATTPDNDPASESSSGQFLTIAEDDYPGRLELAERQRLQGNLAEALGHYRAVIRGAPHLVDRVIAGLLASIDETSEQAAVYRLLGDAYTRRGNYMEALEAYNRGLAVSRGQ